MQKGNIITTVLIIVAVGAIGAWMFMGRTPIETPNVASPSATPEATATINGKTISLLVADTAEEQDLGLGNRQNLPEDQGMIFVFETPDIYEFWMKDMKFPIDIIWLDPNFKVVHIEPNVAPSTYPDTTFASPAEALYVLETNAGFSEKNNLKVGDTIQVSLKK